jgi:hypothetical protein
MREPYLVTVIRQIAGLEATDTLSPDDTARLGMCRRWLNEHYPAVSAALAREYEDMRSREAPCRGSRSPAPPAAREEP